MNFSKFSCSNLSTFLSDPIRKQCAMSKTVQESNLKEGSAVATPKLVNLNLWSMRKIPSQGVSPARSWKQSAWATDDGPTMYSQERQQNDAQASSHQETGAKRRISSTPSWKESAQGGDPSLRKAEARIPKYADLQFKVLGESLQEHKKGESCRRWTTSGIQARKTNIMIWRMFMSASMKAAIHMGPDCTEILYVWKNTIFEELQNLFDITQKMVHKQGEILKCENGWMCISFMDQILAGS